MRERMSRPKLSVPRRCPGESGGASGFSGSISSGLYFVNSGAPTVTTIASSSIEQPTMSAARRRTTLRRFRARRSRTSSSATDGLTTLIRLPRSFGRNPGIESRMHDIRDEVDQHDEEREHERRSLYDGVVARRDG